MKNKTQIAHKNNKNKFSTTQPSLQHIVNVKLNSKDRI